MSNKPERTRFPRCPDCGGKVALTKGEGRRREYLRGIFLHVPDNFEIPTCMECGEESMVPEIAEELDILMGQILLADVKACVESVRAKYEVTNQAIEDALGVTRSYLSHLLAGRQPSPTLLKLLRSFVDVPGAFAYACGREPRLASKTTSSNELYSLLLVASAGDKTPTCYRPSKDFGDQPRTAPSPCPQRYGSYLGPGLLGNSQVMGAA